MIVQVPCKTHIALKDVFIHTENSLVKRLVDCSCGRVFLTSLTVEFLKYCLAVESGVNNL